jgi:hypothetical protein
LAEAPPVPVRCSSASTEVRTSTHTVVNRSQALHGLFDGLVGLS